MTFGGRERDAWVLATAIGLYYAVLGLVILAPESVYSGDIGVQFVQAQALIENDFRSLSIRYPGEFLDPDHRFFPIRPPFVFDAGGSTQSIFPPASALLQAVGVGAFGLRGMILISVVAGWATLIAASRLVAVRGSPFAVSAPSLPLAVVATLGLASPLWFYAVSGWHHAAGMAFGTVAFVCAFSGRVRGAPLLAGISLGAGATLRDEVILLAPGVALAAWIRHRAAGPVLQVAAGAVAALALAAAIDVWWFDRPAAAHLRHAVHFLQSALQTTDAANAELPVLHPMTWRERHQTVVQYWLFGYGNDRMLAAFAAGLALALVVRWKLRTSAALVAWLAAVTWAAAVDFHELVTAPKWLAGLHRVAPYLVFAVLPRPWSGARSPALEAREPGPDGAERLPFIAVCTAAAYLILAFAGVDTTGGKGLGPRLLLPLVPLLTAAALFRIREYLRGDAAADRWAGRIGVLLIAMLCVMHTYAATRAYHARNQEDAAVIDAVSGSAERIVVADELHTAQLLFPLYYRKIIFLADSPPAGDALATMLSQHRLPGVLVVSRSLQPGLVLPGMRKKATDQIGRMSITHWVR